MGKGRSHDVPLSWVFLEELDSLIGEKREKLGPPLLGCPPPGLAGSGPIRPLAPPVGLSQPLHSIHPAPGPIPGKNPLQDLLGGHVPSCYGQTYSHLSPGLAPPGPPQPLFPQPDGHLELRAQPGTPQDSPLPANTPPSHSAKLLAEPSPARTMHDTLLPDGDLGTDLDAINPSLTDFDFQGELGVGKGRWDRTGEVRPAEWPIPSKSPGCSPELPGFWSVEADKSRAGEGCQGAKRKVLASTSLLLVPLNMFRLTPSSNHPQLWVGGEEPKFHSILTVSR